MLDTADTKQVSFILRILTLAGQKDYKQMEHSHSIHKASLDTLNDKTILPEKIRDSRKQGPWADSQRTSRIG